MDNKAQKNNKNVSLNDSPILKRNTLYAFFTGVVLTLISWIIGFAGKDVDFSLAGFFQLHSLCPILFIIELSIIYIPLAAYYITKPYEIRRLNLESELSEKNENIQKYANFAKMIGEKNFSVDIDVEENDELGNALLVMRNNLAEANQKETEQNWISQGKDKISNILRLHNNIDKLAYETLVTLIDYTNTIQGSFYLFNDETEKLVNIASYAYNRKKYINQEFEIGQGLIGQCAFEMDYIYRKEIPEDYVTITSGILGDKKPCTILIVPLISDEKLQGVIEFASLKEDIPELTIKFVRELAEIIAQTVFNLKVNAKTEKLLKEARIMTEELKENEEELRQNAEEMRATQEELQKTNKDLETQIREVENAQRRLHSLLENASEVISIYDENGIIKYESPSVKHILGYDPEEVMGKNAFEVIHTEDDNLIKQVFYELLQNPDQTKTFEYQFKKNDDEVLWLESIGRNLMDNPAIDGIIFNTRDITVRKIAEKAQRMSGQMQALSENSVDMIMRINLEGRFFYANPMVEYYTGIKTKDIYKRTLDEVNFQEKIINIFKDALETIKENSKKLEKEFRFQAVNEDNVIMSLNAIPEFNEEKELETILLVVHDITEQKRIEQVIKEKNKKINDSINYAQRIQSSILPDNKLIRQYLPESFILYKPRDVVSGDFPWFFKRGDNIFIAAVDCTGHGVPGALLSFIGYFLLNNIVDHDRDITAGQILDILHAEVRKTLRQDEEGASARDGMDIAFCKIVPEQNKLEYAGAHRPLYLLRDDEIKQFKGNPKAIGGIPHRRKKEKDFTNYEITINEGDKYFFFSDGLPDQIGGPKGRKYMPNRIREEIIAHRDYSMTKYMKYFARDFKVWKGDNKQIDDVLMIGIEF